MEIASSLLLYHRVRRALSGRAAGAALRPPPGLNEGQWGALAWIAWQPCWPLLMAFVDGCALPRHLRLDDGSRIPVDARRGACGRSHAWIRALNAATPGEAGTMTALVRQRSSNGLYALTAGHVVAAARSAVPGDRIILQDAASSRGVNGRLEHWTPSFHAGPIHSSVDAGLARLPFEQARELIDIGLALPTGVDEPRIGDSLFLRTRGTAIPLQVTGLMTVLLSVGQEGAQVQLVEGLSYLAVDTPMEGDSGAPLWSGRERLAAMHVGGELSEGPGNGVAIPIRRALDWCDCGVLERDAPLLDLPAPVSAPAAPARPAPAAATAPAAANGLVQLTLARTLWGEARGEGISGMEAVACVVLNRVRRQTYWGKNVVDVCRKPYQFSCWNASDPNSATLMRLVAESPELAAALPIAARAIANELADRTAGATHYHARRLVPPPRWARGHAPCATIGNHLFYNDID